MQTSHSWESITVDVFETPLPEGESVQGFDPGDTLADFEIIGENLTWYQDADGILEIPDTTPIVEGVTYYVSQTIDGCESELLPVLGQLNMSIGDFTFNELQYYPNPFTDILSISNYVAIERIAVYSINGQLIQNFDVASSEINLNLSALSKGMYLLKITSEGSSKTIKVIKQ